MSVNRVVISGNLTRSPELRQTRGGTAVLAFGVAVNERVRDPQTGEWADRANFVDVTVFGNRADALSRILARGMQVTVDGRLRWSQWQDGQTGRNRSKLEVIAEEVVLPPRNGGRAAQQPQQQQAPYAAPPQYVAPQPQAAPAPQPAPPQPAPPQPPRTSQPPQADVYDEDIPF